MKLGQHKINPGLWKREPEPVVLSDRYLAEIESSRRKAERAWKAAEQAARRAEKQAEKQPTPPNLALRDETRMLVLARLDELRRIEELMRVPAIPRRSVRIVNKGRTL